MGYVFRGQGQIARENRRQPIILTGESAIMPATLEKKKRIARNSKSASVISKYTDSGACAFQDSNADGSQVVNLKNIRVAIYPSSTGKSWIAQGFEIDYVAQGSDIEDTKRAFSDGLGATIHQHLKIHNNINHLLKFAPVNVRLSVLDRVFSNPGAATATYSQVSIHNLPPLNIEFLAVA
jgi:hypothetical protein